MLSLWVGGRLLEQFRLWSIETQQDPAGKGNLQRLNMWHRVRESNIAWAGMPSTPLKVTWQQSAQIRSWKQGRNKAQAEQTVPVQVELRYSKLCPAELKRLRCLACS